MHKVTAFLLYCLLTSSFYTGCKPKVEIPYFESYKTYYPLRVGKFITYQLDSTILKNFGTGFEVKTYTIKDSVEEQFQDNSNRASYRIIRYKLDRGRWEPNNTFTVTPLENSLEYVENNARIIELVNPVIEGKDWMGNSYISFPPFFSNSDYKTWTYSYTNSGSAFKVNNQIIDNTVTVVSFDSTANKPFYDKAYSSYAKGYEVYAKDIGKVYQDLLNWEYQVDTRIYNCKWVKCVNYKCDTIAIACDSKNCDSINRIAGNRITCDTSINTFSYKGYGTKLTMISHN